MYGIKMLQLPLSSLYEFYLRAASFLRTLILGIGVCGVDYSEDLQPHLGKLKLIRVMNILRDFIIQPKDLRLFVILVLVNQWPIPASC